MAGGRGRLPAGRGAVGGTSGKGLFAGPSGSGMPPADQIESAEQIVEGPGGVLYVLDQQNARVVKVTSAEVASTAVGTGVFGYNGDNQPAASAELNQPLGIATDSSGDLYVGDSGNFRLREVSSGGTITTIAGNGTSYPSGCSPDGSPATQTEISPSLVAVASAGPAAGRVFFEDDCGGAINVREISSSGTIQTLWSSRNIQGGFTFDPSGNLYVGADDAVYEFVGGSGSPVVVAGEPGQPGFTGDGGSPTSAELGQTSYGLAFDQSGDLFIGDSANNRVREVTGLGGSNPEINTLAGGGTGYVKDGIPADQAVLDGPSAVAVDSVGDLLIGEGSWSGPAGPFDELRMVQASSGVLSGSDLILPVLAGADLQGEQTGGCNPSELCAQGSSGEPVNTATGDFWSQDTDIAVPGRGIPLALSRAYDSMLAQSGAAPGPLGYGWSFSYGMSVSQNAATGDVTVTQEDGAQDLFVPNGSGGFTSPTRVLATLVENGDGTWTFTRRAREIFTFNSSGQLTKEQDLNGYATTLAYDGQGRLSTVTDPANRTLTFGYDSSNRIHTVTDTAGREVIYNYDSSNNLHTITDLNGGTTTYGYDTSHRLTTIQDQNLNTILTNDYDSQGRVDWQKDGLLRKTTFAYVPGMTTTTSPAGNVTQDDYAGGELYQEVQGVGTPQQAAWQYTYDPTTLGMTSVLDPNLNQTNYTYNSSGDMLSREDAMQHTTLYTWDSLNDLTSITDPKLVKTSLGYDAAGNLQTVSTPLNSQTQTWQYTYGDPSHPGDVTKVKDPDGNVNLISYDAYGDVATVTDAATDETTFGYSCTGGPAAGCFSNVGLLYSEVSPRGNAPGGTPSQHTTSYSYNAFGEPLTVANPVDPATKYTYWPNGYLKSVQDGDANTTSYGYDAANELTTITRADQTTLQNSYDQDGNLSAQIDGATQPTKYLYDPLDRVWKVTDPLNRTTIYTYDGAGNLKVATDPETRTTSYAYNPANELTSISYSDGHTPNVSFGYDPDGQRTSMSDGTGGSSYTWDALHRLTVATNGAGQTVNYNYDLEDNLTGIEYPNSKTVTRVPDAANRLSTITDWLNNKTTLGYDPDSDPQTTTFPTSTNDVDTYGYNNADQLTSITMAQGTSTLAGFNYGTPDGNGQVKTVTPTGVGEGNESYTYNALNQLKSVNGSNYSYDQADNVTQLVGGPTLSYDVANESQTASSSGPSVSFDYDGTGDRVFGGTGPGAISSYSYDQAQRLTMVTPQGESLGGGYSHSIALGANGNAYAWGSNNDGQLGNGGTTKSTTPVQVSSLTGLVSVAAGSYSSLAVKSDGTAWAWGDNNDGQLGNGSTNNSNVPVQVSGLTGAIEISSGAGDYTSLALKSDGTVWDWGYNDDGQLGNNTTTNSDTPVQVSNLTGIVQIASGAVHNLALKSDGTVWAWGSGSQGQLGNGGTTKSTVPVQVHNLTGVVAIAAGGNTSLALKSDGTVWAWGYNNDGQLGNGNNTNSDVPVQVSNITGVVQIAAGEYHSLAVTKDGTEWAWGNNADGEYGNGSTTTSSTPVHITGLSSLAGIAGGASHTLLMTAGGAVDATGANSQGELGNGTTTASTTPVVVTNLSPTRPFVPTTYTYDGDGIRATSTTAGTTQQYAYDQSASVPLILTDGSTNYIYDDNSLPVEEILSNGTVHYYHHDQLGSTRLLTGSTGTVGATFTYNANGTLTNQTGSSNTPLRWAGQYQDPQTGLYYMRARYYDPTTAQFITRDPLAAQTREPYAYADDNPLTYTDPSGLDLDLGIISIPTPSWNDIGNAAAGFGDTVTFGGTAWVRRQLGWDNVNYCSSAYGGGGVGALTITALIPGGDAEDVFQLAAEDTGDLTAVERQQIQDVVDEAGRPIEVVGSAARGTRGPGSDIDYTAPNSSHPYLQPHAGDLPGLDPEHGILHGGSDPFQGPSIRFEPGS